jgi:L-seryl-tRNA(Ser) seleniumtransferase
VNNNASSVFLILNQFAKGKEVVISRSELIQIGGGFRIPDIMNQTGAVMVETGTTNITDLEDFKNAFTENTSMIFSAHQSNYIMIGFTKNPAIKELASLKTESIILVRDLGSGNLVNDSKLPQPFEPTITSELSQGADLVCFSGDKLLGSCQAGIIIGRKDLVAKLRKNPLMRMLRVDKVTYFILQETLLKYANNSREEILLWKTIYQEKKTISARISRMLKLVKKSDKLIITKIDTRSTFGGGSMPGIEFDSNGIQIEISGMKPDEIYSAFIKSEFPVLGTVINDRFTLDFIAIFDNEIPLIASIINKISVR